MSVKHSLLPWARDKLLENRMLRRIFKRKKEEINGVCTKLHSDTVPNEELRNIYSSPDIIRMIK
jgi:hypothetical protein